ncbi:hypothetical protein [Sphingomonas lenta]|uniref:Uncharacterized protein n=1 Tax=Sphingomonas lenta TaxID=1141887 RepID=A0A2A2SB97_9SPHN|nr:hypothetical protein [Sphingomonas lenta]PAX06527.1 hypothetical protein CKY28_15340 [Sphingomonas lenta]
MNAYIYSAWFLDTAAHEADQDREWVACIGIAASSPDEAQRWGDILAQERSHRVLGDQFIRSSVELESDSDASDISDLPRIGAGDRASDALIGW